MHHDYAEEKREAWRLLGERLDDAFATGKVVSIQRAA